MLWPTQHIVGLLVGNGSSLQQECTHTAPPMVMMDSES